MELLLTATTAILYIIASFLLSIYVVRDIDYKISAPTIIHVLEGTVMWYMINLVLFILGVCVYKVL